MRVTYFIVSLGILLSCFTSKAQNILPETSQISLLTASPGEELYTTFGHSAIRIKDTLNNKDFVYNYGVFNFRTPNFYPKFIQGKLMYRLGFNSLDSFLSVYIRENRAVTERVMNLTENQKVDIIDFLSINYMPENREYLYDFFYDNCATRIRDVIESESGSTFEYNNQLKRNVTFRQLLDEYLETMPWADFGIDLILGLKADEQATFRHQMFLPDYLESNLAKGLVDGKPLFSESTTLLPYQFKPDRKVGLFTPVVTMSLIFILIALFTFFIKNKTLQNIFDWLFFLVLGIMGWVFIFMWLGTNHQACYQNLNMLWANPLYLIVIPLAIIKKHRWIWWFTFILTGILLVTFPFFPQQYHIAFIPIFLIILVRCFYRIKM